MSSRIKKEVKQVHTGEPQGLEMISLESDAKCKQWEKVGFSKKLIFKKQAFTKPVVSRENKQVCAYTYAPVLIRINFLHFCFTVENNIYNVNVTALILISNYLHK